MEVGKVGIKLQFSYFFAVLLANLKISTVSLHVVYWHLCATAWRPYYSGPAFASWISELGGLLAVHERNFGQSRFFIHHFGQFYARFAIDVAFEFRTHFHRSIDSRDDFPQGWSDDQRILCILCASSAGKVEPLVFYHVDIFAII